jgi:hypothetical protein
LYEEMAMNVGSIRFFFIETREASRWKDFFIFSMVYF